MKNLTRKFLVITLFLYLMLGYSIISPWLSELLNIDLFGMIGIMSSVFCFLVFFIGSSILGPDWTGIFNEENTKKTETWLLYHSIFTNVSAFYYPLLMFFLPFAFIFLGISNFTRPLFLMSVIGILSWTSIWFFQKILGMNYLWLGKGKLLGVRSYAELAHRQLICNEKEGIYNLFSSVSLLKELLAFDDLMLEDLDKSLITITCFMNFKCKPPFEKMKNLADDLKEFESLKKAKLSLSKFINSQETKWVRDFTLMKKIGKQPSSNNLLKIVTALAAIFSGLTFIPEANRQELLTNILTFNSPATIQFLSGAILIVVIFYFSTIMEPYRLSFFELKKYKIILP